MLALIPGVGPLLSGAWAFATSRIGQLAIVAVVVGSLCWQERGKHDASASLRILADAQQARIEEMERRATAREKVIADFETLKTRDETKLSSLEERTRAYEAELAKGKGDAACRIDARDRRGLR